MSLCGGGIARAPRLRTERMQEGSARERCRRRTKRLKGVGECEQQAVTAVGVENADGWRSGYDDLGVFGTVAAVDAWSLKMTVRGVVGERTGSGHCWSLLDGKVGWRSVGADVAGICCGMKMKNESPRSYGWKKRGRKLEAAHGLRGESEVSGAANGKRRETRGNLHTVESGSVEDPDTIQCTCKVCSTGEEGPWSGGRARSRRRSRWTNEARQAQKEHEELWCKRPTNPVLADGQI
jgi:hypothetical protein